MRNRKTTVLSPLLLLVASLSIGQQAYAESYVSKAYAMCKAEANAKYGAEDGLLRTKFKAATGSQVKLTILLQVFQRDADSFKVMCNIDGRAHQVVSIERKDRLGDMRIVGAHNNNMAP